MTLHRTRKDHFADLNCPMRCQSLSPDSSSRAVLFVHLDPNNFLNQLKWVHSCLIFSFVCQSWRQGLHTCDTSGSFWLSRWVLFLIFLLSPSLRSSLSLEHFLVHLTPPAIYYLLVLLLPLVFTIKNLSHFVNKMGSFGSRQRRPVRKSEGWKSILSFWSSR